MRYNLYTKLQEQDGITIFNPNSLDWSQFKWQNGYYKHIVSKSDVLKPYMISYAYYGKVDYEDMILLVNNIDDPFALVPGTEIYIPTLANLQSFILSNRK